MERDVSFSDQVQLWCEQVDSGQNGEELKY